MFVGSIIFRVFYSLVPPPRKVLIMELVSPNSEKLLKEYTYTKSCMLKRILARDWDAHKVAKRKEQGRTDFMQRLFSHVSLSNKSSLYLKLILTKMTNRDDGLEDWEYQEKMLAENDRGREPEWRPQRSFGHYLAETGPYFTWVLNMHQEKKNYPW